MKILSIILFSSLGLSDGSQILNINKNLTYASNRVSSVDSLFDKKDLGEISNPSEEEILRTLKKKFLNIEWSFLSIDDITYTDFRVFANNASNNQYIGYTYISYKSVFKSNFQWDSKKVQVDKYNGSLTDKDTSIESISVDFGYENFLKLYKDVEISWKGWTYNNKDGDRYYNPELINDNGVSKISDEKKYLFASKKYKIPTSKQSENKYTIVERSYSNVNKMTAGAAIRIYWEEAEEQTNSKVIFNLKIEFLINVYAYSYWGNTSYARSYAQLHVDEINVS